MLSLPAEMPVLKLLLLAFFWFHRPVRATLCTDYRQIWQGGGRRQHLTYCQSWKFSGVIWGITAQKNLKKRLNNLENAIKNFYFRPVSTNPLVKN